MAYPIAFVLSIPARFRLLRNRKKSAAKNKAAKPVESAQTEAAAVENAPKSGGLNNVRLIAAYALAITACMACGIYIDHMLSSSVAVTVSSYGKTLGTVENVSLMDAARSQLAQNIASLTGMDVSESDYTYDLAYKFTDDAATDHYSPLGYYECYALLNDMNPNGLINAYQLYVDGEYIAASDDPATLDEAVSDAAENMTSQLGVYDVKVTSDIQIIEAQCAKSMFRDASEIAVILEGFSTGDELMMLSAQTSAQSAEIAPKFRYNTVRHESFTTIVKKTRVWRDDFDNYTGYQYQSETGSDGIEEIVYEVVLSDTGEELSRTEIDRVTVVEMHPDVVMVGAVTPPAAVSTGEFIWPIKGEISITSYFGEQREEFDGDSFHYGIDIDVPENTPVWAADGGEVIYCATTRSYGTMIMIAHDDGYKSVYAHLNQAYVEVGDMVYPGQHIADSGNTGVTTGPHLHFEIRLLDIVVDPLKLLPALN